MPWVSIEMSGCLLRCSKGSKRVANTEPRQTELVGLYRYDSEAKHAVGVY